MTDDPQPSITCPNCGRTSYNPNDIRESYCGFCHSYTRGQTQRDTLAALPPVCPPLLVPRSEWQQQTDAYRESSTRLQAAIRQYVMEVTVQSLAADKVHLSEVSTDEPAGQPDPGPIGAPLLDAVMDSRGDGCTRIESPGWPGSSGISHAWLSGLSGKIEPGARCRCGNAFVDADGGIVEICLDCGGSGGHGEEPCNTCAGNYYGLYPGGVPPWQRELVDKVKNMEPGTEVHLLKPPQHGRPASKEPRQCPDSGQCGHECLGMCWRVLHVGPLSIAKYPGDRWPAAVLEAEFCDAVARETAERMVPVFRSLGASVADSDEAARNVHALVRQLLPDALKQIGIGFIDAPDGVGPDGVEPDTEPKPSRWYDNPDIPPEVVPDE